MTGSRVSGARIESTTPHNAPRTIRFGSRRFPALVRTIITARGIDEFVEFTFALCFWRWLSMSIDYVYFKNQAMPGMNRFGALDPPAHALARGLLVLARLHIDLRRPTTWTHSLRYRYPTSRGFLSRILPGAPPKGCVSSYTCRAFFMTFSAGDNSSSRF